MAELLHRLLDRAGQSLFTEECAASEPLWRILPQGVTVGAPLRTAAIANGAPPDVADVPVRLLARTLVCDERHLRARRSRMRVHAASQLLWPLRQAVAVLAAVLRRSTRLPRDVRKREGRCLDRARHRRRHHQLHVRLPGHRLQRPCLRQRTAVARHWSDLRCFAAAGLARTRQAASASVPQLERRCLLPARFGERRVEVLGLVIWVEARLAWQRNVSPSAECTPPGATAQGAGRARSRLCAPFSRRAPCTYQPGGCGSLGRAG